MKFSLYLILTTRPIYYGFSHVLGNLKFVQILQICGPTPKLRQCYNTFVSQTADQRHFSILSLHLDKQGVLKLSAPFTMLWQQSVLAEVTP